MRAVSPLSRGSGKPKWLHGFIGRIGGPYHLAVLSEPQVGDGWEVVIQASANLLSLVLAEQTLLVRTR